jgi:hypothetical protein
VAEWLLLPSQLQVTLSPAEMVMLAGENRLSTMWIVPVKGASTGASVLSSEHAHTASIRSAAASGRLRKFSADISTAPFGVGGGIMRKYRPAGGRDQL